MPRKSNKIQIGDLWQEKDSRNKTIYIVVDIIKHPIFNDSVTLKRIDVMDGGSFNIGIEYLRSDYRKLA